MSKRKNKKKRNKDPQIKPRNPVVRDTELLRKSHSHEDKTKFKRKEKHKQDYKKEHGCSFFCGPLITLNGIWC